MDSQIKLHGYRIELGEIETQLRSAPGVRDAVVIPSMRDGRPSSLTAAVLVDPMPADARTAAETLRRVLAGLAADKAVWSATASEIVDLSQ